MNNQLLESKKDEAKKVLGKRAAEIIARGIGIDKWNSKTLTGCCPIHKGDNTPSFAWFEAGNCFKCFGCQETMDIIRYYMDYEHLSYKEAVKKLLNEVNIPLDLEITKYNSTKEVKDINKSKAKDFSKIMDKALVHQENAFKYLRGRGISEEVLQRYKHRIGWLPNGQNSYNPNHKLVILANDDLMIYRNMVNDEKKYKNEGIAGVSNIEYLNDPNIKYIFIVEGFIDMLSIESLGYHAIALNSANNTKKLIKEIIVNKQKKNENPSQKVLILAGDNDIAGQAMNKDLAIQLSEQKVHFDTFIIPLEIHDINVFLLKNKEELNNSLDKYIKSLDNKNLEENFVSIKEIEYVQPGFTSDGHKIKGLFELNNCYCTWIKINEEDYAIKEISDFIIEPLEKIETENENLLKVNIVKKNGQKQERVFDIRNDLMSGYGAFKKALNDLLVFEGKDKELENIKKLILSKDFSIKKGITTTGFHNIDGKWIFAASNKIVDESLQIVDDMVLLSENESLDSHILDTEPITKEELQLLSNHLFKFNSLGKVGTIIGTAASMLLKEKLYYAGIKLYHLLIIGEAGSGKSSTNEDILLPILNMDNRVVAADKITKFTAEKITSSSNTFPYLIDEYKPYLMKDYQINIISDLVRNLYGAAVVYKGNVALKTISYTLKAPLVLIGEAGTSETAIIERSLQVDFCKSDSRTDQATTSFKFLKENKNLLNKFGRALLNEAIKTSSNELKKLHESCLESIVSKEVKDSRIMNSIACCILGIGLIKKVYDSLNIDFSITGYSIAEVIKSINNTAIADLLDNNENTKTAIDIMLETIDILADTNQLSEDFDYKLMNGHGVVALQSRRIYETIRRANIREGILPERDFTKQLRKAFPDLEYKYVKLKKSLYESESVNQKCYVIKFIDLEKRGLDLNKLSNSFDKIASKDDF